MATIESQRVQLQHLAVYGYIRQSTKYFPDDLKNICYKFYLKVFDKWDIDKCSGKLDIDVNKGIIEAKYNHEKIVVNAFGTNVVTKGDVEIWKIKPLIDKSYESIFVGIVESCKASKDMFWSFAAPAHKAGIAYMGVGRLYDSMNANDYRSCFTRIYDKWEYPQEIILTLDMSVDDDVDRKYGRLSMRKGDANEITISHKIDMNKLYRLAVSMYLSQKGNNHHKMQLTQE